MRKSFQPRKVSADAWLGWCKEAILLAFRHPLRNALLALLFCLPYLYLPGANSNLLLILFLLYSWLCPPIAISVMVVASYCSDYSAALWPRLFSLAQFSGILKTAAFYALIIILTLLMSSVLIVALLLTDFPTSVSQDAAQQASETLKPAFLSFHPGEKLWWSLAVYLFFGASTWFIAPLMCIAHCPFTTGVKLAYRTLVKNPFMFWLPILIAGTLTPLCWLSGIFALPAVILIGALIYISFRDIFMDRKHNFPATVKGQVPVLARQH